MEKTNLGYQIKAQPLEIKDLDENSRKVAFYLSAFDKMDADRDIIRRGAFKKSLQERGPQSASNRKIAYLRYHNWEMPIGKFLELAEDNYGLYAVGELGNSTLGTDALHDYKDGIIREHSIGFKYIADKVKFIETDQEGAGFYEVSEVALWEGSAVTFGANEFTNVVDVAKTEGHINTAQKLSQEIDLTIKALANGKGTDERLYNMEMKLKFLNAQLLALATAEPFDKHSVKSEPQEKPLVFNWEKVGDFYEKQTYKGYPQTAVNNAKKGIRLNEAVGNKCATAVGKQRARDIVAKRAFSLDTLKRVYSYLSRAKAYYDANDEKACGTISYLLWGGESMRVWSEKKLAEIENNNN